MSKTTQLHGVHEALGARFTDFAGWDMPLRYESELEEHHAVRNHAGIFDLSHMGVLWVQGPEAVTALNSSLAGDFAPMAIGRAKYTLMLTEQGGIVDDMIVYRIDEDRFMVVPNASNTDAVYSVMEPIAAPLDAELVNETAGTAILAIQGPAAENIVAGLVTVPQIVKDLKYYRCAQAVLEVNGVQNSQDNAVEVIVARTGYTGEDGFEIYVDNAHAEAVWQAALAVDEKLVPAGLTARDSLRLEAGMPLYGNELSTETSPATAGMAGIVKLDKAEDFPGKEAVAEASAQEPQRKLVGLSSDQRRAARAGSTVLNEGGEEIGQLTSGQPSPTLQKPVALGYLDVAHAEPGTQVHVDVRGKTYPFTVVELPFYRRAQ